MLKQFGDVPMEQWDDFVLKSPEAWLYHSGNYIKWLLSNDKSARAYALCTNSGEISSIFTLSIVRDYALSPIMPLRFAQRAVNKICREIKIRSPGELRILTTGYSGFAFIAGVSKKNKKRYVKEILRAIDEIAERERCDELQVRNTDIADANENGELLPVLWSAGLHEPFSIPPRLFARIDLEKPEKELWSGIDEDCRAEINKAKREGVAVECDPEDALERFYAIHSVSWARTYGYHHPKEYFIEMMKNFGDAFHFFIAKYQGKDVAAVVLHCYKGAVMYYSGGSILEGQKVNANNFALYNAIMWAKAAGYSKFAVGIFDAFPGRSGKEYNVGQYKAQFVAQHIPAVELKKYYSMKAVRRDYWIRCDLLNIQRKQARH